MAEVKDNYQLLIDNLDRFTRKYYVNQLIRGALYTVALLVFLFIVMNMLEYFYYFSKTCLLYTSPSPRDQRGSRMPSSA